MVRESKYIIVGGGMTADAAVRGIRDVDVEGSITVVTAESHAPYKRPPLSKGLWKGQSQDTIWCKTEDKGVTLHRGRRIESLDLANKRLIDDLGDEYRFDKILLATGGRPRRLPFDRGTSVVYFRTLDDYLRLRRLCEEYQRFAVVGGGFIGAEIAAALALSGKQVSLMCSGRGIGARTFPSGLVDFLNGYYQERGVKVMTGERAVSMDEASNEVVLRTEGGDEILADIVVAGVGIEPNVELATSSGLEVEDGIRVDRSLRTNHPDVFAAGDVASFYSPALEKFIRVEHEDNAYAMGRAAGQAMAGRAVSYDHLPFFYSDLFDLGYEAVGEVDSSLEMVSDWKERYREGVVYYFRDQRLCGVLLWNVWGRIEDARRWIAERKSLESEKKLRT